MMIKICGITNLDDALLAAEEGATALGFVFHTPSPRAVSEETAAAIIMRIPRQIWKVGVFVDRDPADIGRVAAACGLDVAQLHGSESPAQAPHGVRVWKAVRVGPDGPETGWPPEAAEAFVLDTSSEAGFGGTGKTFPWHLARSFPGRVILAGGLDASNVAEAVRLAQPWGVDASSRLESAPGRKDPARVKEFVRAARAAWKP
jgi:phosphoribosylanthranilate isomerase